MPSLAPLLIPVAATLGGLVVGIGLRRVVWGRLTKAAAQTASRADDLVLAALRGPIVLWCALLGLYLSVGPASLAPAVGHFAEQALRFALIASLTWVAARLAGDLVRERARSTSGLLPASNLATNLTRVLVLTLGGLVGLESLGISVTPLVTALGVGGLAVGLALQDTLANLFAGIHILASRQVRPGDFIRLSTGEEGYVQDVTWRYTTIRQLPNNLTIVPNTKLASAVTSNFNLPDREQAVLVDVSVAYGADLREVERVTVEVAKDVMETVDGGVPGFAPFVRYHTFADSGIAFTVILRGRDYVAQYLLKHEFIKRLHERYRHAGIEIPYPTRSLHLDTISVKHLPV